MFGSEAAFPGVRSLEAQADDLQAMIDDTAASSGMVGVQVSVIQGDRRADFVYGSANVELSIPMSVDTIVQIGSVTKVFNAALIMTLVEEGSLALDTPVIKYIPDFKLSDRCAQETITLRHLLSMSSGMDNGPYNEHGRGEDALARYVASLGEVPQIFPPGQGYGYSNAGSCVAGYVAERVSGEKWDTLMQTRIFEPAGLTHAITLAEELAFHRVSVGHLPPVDGLPAKVIRPWYLNRSMGPAGSTLTMSAHELASFGRIFVNGGNATDGRRVLSEASVRTMMTPTADVPVTASLVNAGAKWGLGPSMDRWGDTVVWGHAGGSRSGSSRLAWLPEKRGVLAVTMNSRAAGDAFIAKIFGDFSSAVFGARVSLPVAPKIPVQLEKPQRYYVGHYMRYGTRIEISEESGRLRFKEINLGSGKPVEQLGVTYDSTLIHLGGHRFLIEAPGCGQTPVSPTAGVACFLGSDGHDRAAIIVTDPILAARRVQ